MPAASSGAKAASRSAVAAPAGPEPTMTASRRSTNALLAPRDGPRHCPRPSPLNRAQRGLPFVVGHETLRLARRRSRAPAHRARPQLDSPDPPRDNGAMPRPRASRVIAALAAVLLAASSVGASHRALLLRARGGAGRGHDHPAGEGADGVRLGGGGRADREPRGAGTGARRARRARAAALPALPPALHARP